MTSPIYGRGTCGRCGKDFEVYGVYEPTTVCMKCTIERAANQAKVWRCPVKRNQQGVKR